MFAIGFAILAFALGYRFGRYLLRALGVLFVALFVGISLAGIERSAGPVGSAFAAGLGGLALCAWQGRRLAMIAAATRQHPLLAVSLPAGYLIIVVGLAAGLVAFFELALGFGGVWYLALVAGPCLAVAGHWLMRAPARPRAGRWLGELRRYEHDEIGAAMGAAFPAAGALIIGAAALRPDLAWIAVAAGAVIVTCGVRTAAAVLELQEIDELVLP